jgi:acetyltransferase
LLRPIAPEDQPALERFARGLSSDSRYLRFHAAVTELPANAGTILTHVDGHDHFALVATHPADRANAAGGDVIVGVARMIRERDAQDAAEVAITVADDFQRRGLGTALFRELLEHAPARNIRILRAYVLAANVGMRRMLTASRLPMRERESGVIEVELAAPGVHRAA